MFNDEIKNETVNKFLRSNGQKGVKILTVLAKSQPFYNAISSSLGQELLNDVVTLLESKLELIIEEKASEKDLAEYRALKDIARRWSVRVNTYLVNLEKVKNNKT